MMIVTTIEHISGYEIEEILGLVIGNIVHSKHLGKDIAAAFKTLAGGEIRSYTEMMTEARNKALERMIDEAEKLGADAVLGVRFGSSAVMSGAAEMLAYGTAVKLRKKEWFQSNITIAIIFIYNYIYRTDSPLNTGYPFFVTFNLSLLTIEC